MSAARLPLLEGEEAGPVRGHRGYFVTSLGRVFSTKYGLPHELCPDVSTCGGLRVTLCKRNRPKRFVVARLVAGAFLGPRRGRLVIHRNADSSDNRLENLFYGTKRDLTEIMVAIPAVCWGERQNLAKLSVEKVRTLRRLRDQGTTFRALGKRYGISLQGARAAALRQTWSRVR